MKQLVRTLALIAALATASGLSGCGSENSSAPPTVTPAPVSSPSPMPVKDMMAGLVTDVGGLHDRSFNDLSWNGVQRAHRQFGIRARVFQSRTESDYVKYLSRLAQSHATLVIAVGTTMATAVNEVARQYPGERFAIVDARPQDRPGHEVNLPNVANLLFKEQESGYLVGVMAGLLEKRHLGKAVHNTIGYLGGQAIAPVERYLAGYVAGAERVDPSIKVIGDFAQTFTDERKGLSIGKAQIRQGADILFQVAAQTGFGYLAAAQQQGKYGIGVDADQGYLGKSVISSALKRPDVAVRSIIADMRDGTFKPYDHFYGAAQGATGFAQPPPVVPRSIVEQTRHFQNQIAAGTVVPPVTVPAR